MTDRGPPVTIMAHIALNPGRWVRGAGCPALAAGDWPPFAATPAGARLSDADTLARVVGATGGMVGEVA